jgi:hypothetical protein
MPADSGFHRCADAPRALRSRASSRIERSLAKKQNPFVITAAVAVTILVAAFATLGVLSALAGQKSGLEKSGCKIHCSR